VPASASMRAMPFVPSPGPQAPAVWPRLVAPSWSSVVLWAGVALCIAGLISHRLFEQWVPSRTAALLVLAAGSLGIAWLLRRVARIAFADGLLLTWTAALVFFAGPLPSAATLLFAAAAIALGGLATGRDGVAADGIVGVALFAGIVGWLLPLPLHLRWLYIVICLALIAWRRRSLLAAVVDARRSWRDAVDSAPRSAACAVLLLGLASTACWIPTVQFDDLGYHLRLTWMLQNDARYALDPETHAWALAPWAADIVQAIPQLLAGAEARGAVNAMWIALTATGLWQLCAALGGGTRERWWAVSLYASLPLTAALALGMQTETQTASLLVWLAVLALRAPTPRLLLAAAVLIGALLGTKLAATAFALLALPWLLYQQRATLRMATPLAFVLLMLAVGASSYVYAAIVAGNPVLPLFNAWFESPYFAPVHFDDPRWHAGFDAMLPWNLTFDTDRYQEIYDGGGGFLLVAMAGAWLLALRDRATRPLAVLALLMMAVLLSATQYLRYVYPALVLAIPALVVAGVRADPRRAHWLVALVCALNLAFQANGHWMLRGGIVKDAVMAAGQDAPVFADYAPERLLAARIRAEGATGNVLALDPSLPFAAELGARARTTAWYDPSLQAAAARAGRDPSGAAWAALLRDERIGEVLLREASLSPAQRAGLQTSRAVLRARAGAAEWWSLPSDGDAP
jgi:hypothetical protein